ncbi:MAG: phage holin family protein [Bacteroidota bacterium]
MDSIKDRILKFLRLDGIISNLTGYVETRVALVKIEIREEVAAILSRGLMIMIMFMIGFLFILFVSLGLAQYLNTLLESQFVGYMIVALFFGILLCVLLIGRKGFFKMLEKQFVEMIKHRHE